MWLEMVIKKLSFIMNKPLWALATLLGAGVVLFVFIAGLNGASCRYELSVSTDEKETFMTCYRGKVVLLHTKRDTEGGVSSKWKVEARQLKLGSQAVFFVYGRERISGADGDDDPNDRYNQISEGYSFLFYHFIRREEKLYIFQAFPSKEIYRATLKGQLDFFDKE